MGATGIRWAGMLLITLQCTGQSSTAEKYLASNVSSAHVETFWTRVTLLGLCAKEQGWRRREERLQQKEQSFAFGAGCHGLLWCAYLGGVVCRQQDGLLCLSAPPTASHDPEVPTWSTLYRSPAGVQKPRRQWQPLTVVSSTDEFIRSPLNEERDTGQLGFDGSKRSVVTR